MEDQMRLSKKEDSNIYVMLTSNICPIQLLLYKTKMNFYSL